MPSTDWAVASFTRVAFVLRFNPHTAAGERKSASAHRWRSGYLFSGALDFDLMSVRMRLVQ